MASIPEVGADWGHQPAYSPLGSKESRAAGAEAGPVRTWGWARPSPRPTWTALIAAVVIVGVGVWWVMLERSAPSAVDPQIAAHLSHAQQALIDRHYFEPADASALHYYQLVLALDPNNREARDGIERIASRVLADAEALIPRDKLADAAVAIESIRRVRPAHPQLPRVEALLRQQQERLVLLARQEVTPMPRVAPIPTPAKAASTKATAPTSSTATQALALGRQRLAQGRLLTPENDSAQFHLLAAQRLTPDNLQVRAALRDLRARVLTGAEQALATQDFDSAASMITAARQLGASSRDVDALQSKLQSQQQGGRKDELLQLVLQRTQDNHLMEPLRDSATDYLQQLARLDRRSQAYQRALEALGTRLVANARTAIYQENYEHAAKLVSHARSLGFNSAELESADGTVRTALQNPRQPLTAAQLRRRIRTFEPEFPAEARRTQASGWVDVTLSIAPNGSVVNARVADASVPELFDRAALSAVRKWRYEPRPSSGRKDLDIIDVRLEFHE
ncbi:MAG: energy transducer TonB [Steroidobacteraceae bacterium]